ncbi:MAG: hypothetical protein HKN42_14965 [Granulosicoccus sp.]|nr:hypothetical protein [Granulosicoccus sp.]
MTDGYFTYRLAQDDKCVKRAHNAPFAMSHAPQSSSKSQAEGQVGSLSADGFVSPSALEHRHHKERLVILKAINLFLFWRRNDAKSIIFKSLFWGAFAWLAVGIFTNVTSALIAGGIIAAMAAVKYALINRRENAKLLAKLGGDPEKLAAFKMQMKGKGMAGALMTEMLRAELDDDFDDDDEVSEIDDETRAANQQALTEIIDQMTELCITGGYADQQACEEAANTLRKDYEDGDEQPTSETVIEVFLENNHIGFDPEDFINEGDHADLVETFSAATNGKWLIENCRSTHDDVSDKWVVQFTEKGQEKTWRFAQSRDLLNDKFLQQLIAYTESRSGHIVTILDTDEYVSAVCLPREIHNHFFGTGELQQVA